MRDVTLNAYANQDVPFERIVDALQPDRDLARQPLFQVMLVVHNEPASELRLGSLEVSPVEIPRSSAQFDSHAPRARTPRRPHARPGVQRRSLRRVDCGIACWTTSACCSRLRIEEPERTVADLPILRPTERQLVARAWNATRAPYPDRACLHEIVEAHVDRDPAAAAIVNGGAPMTLGDLEARANQLAHALRQCGVGPDTCVGVGLERSPDLIVATLAVLKAGGAFVPLDARYPAERLTHMVRDAGVSTVIARGGRRRVARPARRAHPRYRFASRTPRVDRTAGAGGHAGASRVRDLHLGLDRHAEGCRRAPWRRAQQRRRPEPALRDWCCRQRPVALVTELRHERLRAPRPARGRRPRDRSRARRRAGPGVLGRAHRRAPGHGLELRARAARDVGGVRSGASRTSICTRCASRCSVATG